MYFHKCCGLPQVVINPVMIEKLEECGWLEGNHLTKKYFEDAEKEGFKYPMSGHIIKSENLPIL